MTTELTIGKVAKQAGVNIQTVRYYERQRLLMPDGHRESGYRLYTGEAVKKLRFIKNAQELGFTLKEIKGLLRLRVSHRNRCDNVKKKAEAKLQNVQQKIKSLKALENVLLKLIRACRNRSTTGHCPIIKSLDVNQGRKKI